MPAVAAGNVEGGASVGASGPASSPFSQAGVHRKIGEGGSGGSVMSIESVTAALEEVRGPDSGSMQGTVSYQGTFLPPARPLLGMQHAVCFAPTIALK